MPFVFWNPKRLRPVRAGVCIALWGLLALLSPTSAQDELIGDSDREIITQREAILRCIESLPSPPTPRQNLIASPQTVRPELPQPPLPTPVPTVETKESLRAAILRLKLPLPLPKAHIVIKKSARTLELFSGKTLVKTYRVALGPNPNGHKQNQGDGRTPEGQFYICTRNAKDSAFHIFLGLSYPALPDATRGVNQKVITWRDYQIIRQRLASRGAPLWQTRLGGWVGIHGGSEGAFAARKKQERQSNDWTAGCIALNNKEIAEIYSATVMGTPVLVRP